MADYSNRDQIKRLSFTSEFFSFHFFRFAKSRFSFSSLFPVEPDVAAATPQETIHVGMILKNVWRPGETLLYAKKARPFTSD